jgi:hypothetical protein
VNEVDITNDGWPVAQPRFTRRPGRARVRRLPLGKMNWSTWGLMFSFLISGLLLEPGDLDLGVEVADVAEDGLVLHRASCARRVMTSLQPVAVTKMSAWAPPLHRDDLVALHRGLERADGVDLGDRHAGAEAAERVRAALAHVAVAATTATLPATITSVARLMPSTERLAAAVEVVELRLGDRVVDVDRGHLERPFLAIS